MLYSGCEIVGTRNATSASLLPRGTDTFLIWNHFSHHQSLRIYFFIPLSPVTCSVTQAATSQIYTNNRSMPSTANGTATSQIDANTGVFSAQPTAQPIGCGS